MYRHGDEVVPISISVNYRQVVARLFGPLDCAGSWGEDWVEGEGEGEGEGGRSVGCGACGLKSGEKGMSDEDFLEWRLEKRVGMEFVCRFCFEECFGVEFVSW